MSWQSFQYLGVSDIYTGVVAATITGQPVVDMQVVEQSLVLNSSATAVAVNIEAGSTVAMELSISEPSLTLE